MSKKIVRLTKEEFEVEDGTVYPITPPLEEEWTIEEFQEHYDRVRIIIEGIKNVGSDNQDTTQLG